MRTGGVLTAYRVLGSFALSAGRYSGSDLAISHDGLMGYSARNGWERHRQHHPGTWNEEKLLRLHKPEIQ